MATIQALKHYLGGVLNIQVEIHPWGKGKNIPFFLRDLYAFYQGAILGRPCLFLVARNEDEIPPGTVNKHINQLKEKWAGFCIYVRPTITSYNRKRLIEKYIPFVIPNSQMYLPELCLDLREHFQTVTKSRTKLRPAAQTVLIYAMTHKDKKMFIPSELAEELNYTRMTMTRAFNELESLGIGKITKSGKERLLYFDERQGLWEQVKPFMITPVKKTVLLKKHGRNKIEKIGVTSGLTALGTLTMLNQPKLPSYAISKADWKKLERSKDIEEVFFPEDADIELQIWNYDPKIFARGGVIDLYSLFLSLQESDDERIEAALESLMEKVK